MSEDQGSGSTGDTQGGSGSTGDNGGSGSTGNDNANQVETVPKSTYESVQADMHKYKSELKSARDEAAEFKKRLEALETQKLADQQDFKTLYEQSQEQLSKAKQKSSDLLVHVQNSERRRALLPELKKLGFRDDADKLLDTYDFSGIEIEATTGGRFLCHGAATVAEEMKSAFPFAFQGKGIGNMNGGGGTGTPPPQGDVTAADVISKEDAYRAGKCTLEEFQAVRQKFVEQQRKQA